MEKKEKQKQQIEINIAPLQTDAQNRTKCTVKFNWWALGPQHPINYWDWNCFTF